MSDELNSANRRARAAEDRIATLEREREEAVAYAEGLAEEAVWEYKRMVSALYPGHDKQEVESIIKAMQDKYGSPVHQVKRAVRAAALAKNPNVSHPGQQPGRVTQEGSCSPPAPSPVATPGGHALNGTVGVGLVPEERGASPTFDDAKRQGWITGMNAAIRVCEQSMPIGDGLSAFHAAKGLRALIKSQAEPVQGVGGDDPDQVICPNCAHQFRAIPENAQAELAALRVQGEGVLPEGPSPGRAPPVSGFAGESESADFEAGTWTFKMEPGYRVGAGRYMIVPLRTPEGVALAPEGGAFTLQGAGPDALDAERYRYLRNVAGQIDGDEDGPMVCAGLGDNFDYLRGPDVDAAVDQAIMEWKVYNPAPANERKEGGGG